MPNFPPDSPRSPRDGRRSLRELMDSGNGAGQAAFRNARPSTEPRWDKEPDAAEDLERTSAEENEHILASLRRDPTPAKGKSPLDDDEDDAPQGAADSAAVHELTDENERLRGIIAELRQLLDETTAKGNDSFEDREREYESLLEEKSELIRNLHVQMKELEEMASGNGGGSAPARSGTPDDSELLALSDELERERCNIEQERRTMEDDRRQLREDEEAMMRQMREMELQMAKERAELARQRNELQRLHGEIRHELELAQRDAAVNERLKLLQRRHQEVTGTKSDDDAPPPASLRPTRKSSQGTQPPKPTKPGDSGMFRRLFRGGDK